MWGQGGDGFDGVGGVVTRVGGLEANSDLLQDRFGGLLESESCYLQFRQPVPEKFAGTESLALFRYPYIPNGKEGYAIKVLRIAFHEEGRSIESR
jgi:hypothetical protein